MSIGQGLIGYRRFLKGDNAALEETVRLYSDALVRFARCYVKDPATAEDIMEDAFVTLLLKRKHFQEEEQLRAYLYKIVRTKCLDHLRGQKHLESLSDYADKLVGGCTEYAILQNERTLSVRRALELLPKQYEEALILSYYKGLDVQELCDALGKTQKQVYNLLARAKTALRKSLIQTGVLYENI